MNLEPLKKVTRFLSVIVAYTVCSAGCAFFSRFIFASADAPFKWYFMAWLIFFGLSMIPHHFKWQHYDCPLCRAGKHINEFLATHPFKNQ